MRFALYSDLHLEIKAWEPPALDVDVVILAGDIGSHTRGLTWAAATFPQPVLYVAGNHEFYDASFGLLAELQKPAWEDAGVTFLERRAVEENGVRFLGCTLWSGFDLHGTGQHQALAMTAARRNINDYWVIRGHGGKRLEPRETLSIHRKSIAWLDAELSRPFDGKTVVVTHFAPHRECVAQQHEGSDVSPYFVTDLSWLMEKHRIDVWCHGHTHTNNDFLAEGGCRVLSNQRGYPGERTGDQFSEKLVVEL
jgi:predicted phosphodiesterase